MSNPTSAASAASAAPDAQDAPTGESAIIPGGPVTGPEPSPLEVEPYTTMSAKRGDDDDDTPDYKLVHALSSYYVCQKASCKKEDVRIQKGELCFGTYFEYRGNYRGTFNWKFKHCLSNGVPQQIPGFDGLTEASQEQVRLAFEAGFVVDKTFVGEKDTGEEDGFKIEASPNSRAVCQNNGCKKRGLKVMKVYKHWTCVSANDLARISKYIAKEGVDEVIGFDSLSNPIKEKFMEAIKNGQVDASGSGKEAIFAAPEEPAKKKKKARKSEDFSGDEEYGPSASQKKVKNEVKEEEEGRKSRVMKAEAKTEAQEAEGSTRARVKIEIKEEGLDLTGVGVKAKAETEAQEHAPASSHEEVRDEVKEEEAGLDFEQRNIKPDIVGSSTLLPTPVSTAKVAPSQQEPTIKEAEHLIAGASKEQARISRSGRKVKASYKGL
ncbi:hypothetical protein K402DRAFT_458619 [Aulographum hederae CBS 113979]|uniref:PARP-type domain-containing protein n=1 Tax=Aulographum hederae CBS 113979 TaxID=1176131 RepID=A0A6G1HG81_9PEZI|nr:hypothetical protein K402DRAFT_458619 [Aulographum hederae CBS 113979]